MGISAIVLVLIHWVFYSLATCLLISVLFNGSDKPFSIYDLSRLNRRSVALAAIALCSMAGIPPFAGFWTKSWLLVSASTCGNLTAVCVCWAVAFISLLFYLTALRYSISLSSINELAKKSSAAPKISGAATLTAAALLLGALFLGDALLLATAILL